MNKRNNSHGYSILKDSSLIGIGYKKQANMNEMFHQYTAEQLEELSTSLKETIEFLEYQKCLSIAFHQNKDQELKHLLENKKEGNLVYLRKDEGWLLRILRTKDNLL